MFLMYYLDEQGERVYTFKVRIRLSALKATPSIFIKS